MPSAKSAATQKTRVVTASFICTVCRARAPAARALPYLSTGVVAGLEIAAVVVESGGVAGNVSAVVALARIRSFWPTTNRSLFNSLAERIAFTVLPNLVAILIKLSPDFTLYVGGPAVASLAASGLPV